MATITDDIAVDWSADGDYLDTGENVTSRVLTRTPVTSSRGRDQIRALAPPMAGTFAAELLNTSRDYSPENASSPLYGNLLPGRSVRWRARADAYSPYDREVLVDAPVGWWRLGEPSGTTALDSSGSGNNGTYTGGVTLGQTGALSGDTDTAALFNGSTGYVEAPTISITTDVTMEAWIYPTLAGQNGFIVQKAPVNGVWQLFLEGGVIKLRGASAGLTVTGGTPAVNAWSHVVGKISGTTGTIYVNAAQTGTGTVTAITNGAGAIEIGRHSGPGYFFTGRIDEVAIYPTALSAARVLAHYEAGRAGTHALWTGILDDLPQNADLNQKSVSLPCLGTLSRLRKRQDDEGISTALYSTILTSVALGHLLDAAGWPTADRVIDTGKTTLSWWWLDNADPFTAMVELLATEGPGAAIYEDGYGRIVFESRHYRLLTARCTTSQATLSDSGSEPLFSAPFSYNPGLKDVINRCTVTVKLRSAKSLAVVWTLGENVALAANEAKTYVARQSSGEPFTAAVTPVAATDYTVQSGSVTSVTLSRTSGASVTITITAGSGGASVTGLQLRAQPVTVDSTGQASHTIDTSTSQTRYGRRTFPLPTRAEIPLATAQDFCNAVVGIYQAPRPQVSLALNNGNATRLAQAFGREISDRVTVVEAQTGINHDYFVEQIAHRATGASHVATFGLEKAVTTGYGIWGTSLWGTGVWGF